MSDKKNVVLCTKEDAGIDSAYREIIAVDQEQNRERANLSLSILPDEARQNVMLSCKYSSYFPNPITKPFMRKYILAKIEFPTKGSELAQSLTELNVRIESLFSDAYTFEKTKLETEGLDIEIAELEENLESAKTESIEERKLHNQVALKSLEKANKAHSLNKTKLAAIARYNEAMGWKGCVEDIMQEMNITSLEEVNFNGIRMDEMAAKVRKWGEMQANEMLEMTPSKLNVILDSQEDFQKGFMNGRVISEYKQIEATLPQIEQKLYEVQTQANNAPTKEHADTLNAEAEALKQQAAEMRVELSRLKVAHQNMEAAESQAPRLLK